MFIGWKYEGWPSVLLHSYDCVQRVQAALPSFLEMYRLEFVVPKLFVLLTKETIVLKEPRPSGHSPNDGSSLLDLILHLCQSLSRSSNLFALCLRHYQALRSRLFHFPQQAQRFLYGCRRLSQLFRISFHLSSVLL